MNGRTGSEIHRCPEAVFADIGRHNSSRAEGFREHEVQQTRDAAAENEHAVAGLKPRKPLAADDTGQRLYKYTLLKTHGLGQDENASIDVQRGNAQVLAEPPGVVIGRVKRLAGRVAALEAVEACVTGDMMGYEHTVPDPVALDSGACLDDHPCDLVPEDDGRLLDPVPLHDVAAADAAGRHLDQQLPRTDPRNGSLFNADVMVVVVNGYLHGLSGLSGLFGLSGHGATGIGSRGSGRKKITF